MSERRVHTERVLDAYRAWNRGEPDPASPLHAFWRLELQNRMEAQLQRSLRDLERLGVNVNQRR